MTALAQNDARVLAYYEREASGILAQTPLAGLKLDSFRNARARLLERGLLERAPNGRYRPAAVSETGG